MLTAPPIDEIKSINDASGHTHSKVELVFKISLFFFSSGVVSAGEEKKRPTSLCFDSFYGTFYSAVYFPLKRMAHLQAMTAEWHCSIPCLKA